MAFPQLLEPFDLGGRELRNRVAWLAHATNFAFESRASERLVAYLERRARAGVGLIVTGPDGVDPRFPVPGRVTAAPAAGYERVASAVRRHGALLVGQLTQDGREVRGDLTLDWSLERGLTAVPAGALGRVPYRMTDDELRDSLELWQTAVGALAQAGYDGVEVDASSGLLAECRSEAPDHLERVLAVAREAGGRGFLVGLRCSVSLTSPVLPAHAGVDYVSVRVEPPFPEPPAASMRTPPRYAEETLRAVRAATAAPLIGGARIATPSRAEATLASGQVDVVGLTRALIADPDWMLEAQRGIAMRPCVASNEGCTGRVMAGRPLTCILNPSAGREADWKVGPGIRLRVAVAGSGPAGMAFARGAARRGCEVTVIERRPRVGGELHALVEWAGMGEFERALEWFSGELERLGVKVALEEELVAGAVTVAAGGLELSLAAGSLEVDALVLATGSAWPDGDGVPSAQAVLAGDAEVDGSRVLIAADADQYVALALAKRLAAAGRDVQLVTSELQIAGVLDPANRPLELRDLYGHGVELTTGLRLVSTEPGAATFTDRHTGESVTLEADDVLVSRYRQPYDGLYRELRARGVPASRVGDCVAPRDVAMAIYSGERLARELS